MRPVLGRVLPRVGHLGGHLALVGLSGPAGPPALPGGRTLFWLVSVGLVVETVGNVGAQWSLGIVGLAVSVPAQFGLMITAGGGAGLGGAGRTGLVAFGGGHGAVDYRASAARAGRRGRRPLDRRPRAVPPGPLLLLLAVGAAGLAGAVYALLSTVIRHSVTRTTTPSAVAFLVPLMATLTLGPLCVERFGAASLLNTPREQLLLLAAAGVFNLIGFLGLIHGLQRTTVVHANVVNASQVAMAALAGMALFHEAPNPWVLLGVGLTILGIVWIDRPAEAIEEIPPP